MKYPQTLSSSTIDPPHATYTTHATDKIVHLNKINLVIAGSYPIYREGLAILLQKDKRLHVHSPAASGEEILTIIHRHTVDVVVLDLELYPTDGLETFRCIKTLNPSIKVIVLTHRQDTNMMQIMLQEGVQGYLMKDASVSEVTQAILSVQSSTNYISPSASHALIQLVKQTRESRMSLRNLELLSAAETRVLRKVATDMTSKEIAAELGVSTRTVENHRARICKKMNISGVHSLVKFAFENRGKL